MLREQATISAALSGPHWVGSLVPCVYLDRNKYMRRQTWMDTWAHRLKWGWPHITCENLWDKVWVHHRTLVRQTTFWALAHQKLDTTWIAFLVVRANTCWKHWSTKVGCSKDSTSLDQDVWEQMVHNITTKNSRRLEKNVRSRLQKGTAETQAWKHYFYSVFSETQLCRNKRVQLEKQEKIPKIGGCLPTCKKVFFVCVFLLFGGLVFFFVCFIFFVWKNAPKNYFRAIFEYFFFFLSPEGLSLESFFSSYSVFSSGFPFVFPFKTPAFFFAFCPSTPFWKTLIFWLLCLSFSCLFLS